MPLFHPRVPGKYQQLKIDNEITIKIIQEIREHAMKGFSLEDCDISEDNLVSIIDALKKNKTVVGVELRELKQPIGQKGMEAICDLLKTEHTNITAIGLLTWIEWNPTISNTLKEALINNTTLQILNISGDDFSNNNSAINDIADVIVQNKTLTHIALFSCGLKDEDARILANAIAQNPNLESLYLNNNHITDQGAQYLIDAIKETNNHLITLIFPGNPAKDDKRATIQQLLSLEQRNLRNDISFIPRR